jgi:histidyl-tRNA synthetase
MTAKAIEGTGLDASVLIEKIRKFIVINDVDSMRSAFDVDGELLERVEKRIAQWRELISILDSLGVGAFISPDLGIVRGLAYYTGFVFEAFQTVGTGRALAGGGRYDNLVKKLGYQDMSAVGFGMGDVTVADLLELTGKTGALVDAPDAYLVIGSDSVRSKALELATSLRRSGVKVDYPLKSQSFGKQFKQADAVGAKKAIILGEDELSAGIVKVKDLKSGEETQCAFFDILKIFE